MAIVNNGMFMLSLTIILILCHLSGGRQVNTRFLYHGADSIAYVNATGGTDALHYLITTIGHHSILFIAKCYEKKFRRGTSYNEERELGSWKTCSTPHVTNKGANQPGHLCQRNGRQHTTISLFTIVHVAYTHPIRGGLPTVLVAHTGQHAELHIDWDKFASGNQSEMAGAIKFTNTKVFYSYAVALTRLIEYNDTKDKADMTKYGPYDVNWNIYDFANFTWENMTQQDDNTILFDATRADDDIWSQNGSLTFKFSAYDHTGRESELPHLQFSENITQFDFTVDHLTTNLSMSRFALEAVMVSDGQTAMKIDETRSIDDEYSPGVFKINNWLSKTGNIDDTGFLQWKPVCYQKSKRARSVATGMKHYPFVDPDDSIAGMLNKTVLFGYYGDGLSGITRKMMNFSFGIGKDGGYNKTSYLAWSASIGYGKPPEDKISILVIIVISVGLGLPVVIILLGGIYVCAKKKDSKPAKSLKNVQDGYQPIANGQVDT